MKKKATQGTGNLFEANEPPKAQTEAAISSPLKIENPCPHCGGRSLKTVRSYEHENHTHYCAGGCLSEDRTDAYYFTPRAETFDEQAAREEAKKIVASEMPPTAPKFAPLDLPIKPYFEENGIAILHGDNREILPQLGIYDLILTDPPYGIGEDYASYEDTKENLKRLIKEVFPLIRRSATVVLMTPGNSNQYLWPRPDWTLAWVVPAAITLGPWGFCSWQPFFAYGKDPYLREGMGSQPDIFICNEASEINGHPTPKPNTVWKWFLKRGASRSTDRILDPFLGSGTTLWAAKQLGHSAIGIEIEEKYCEIAANRLRQSVIEF
jgi:site-specific DNA-methyltransferase (adenine-specific)